MTYWGKNKNNIEQFISMVNELKGSLTTEELSVKYEEMKANLLSGENDILAQSPPATKGRITSIFAIFKPAPGYFITPILINLNIAIFILMVLSGVDFMLPDKQSLINWGANFRPLTLEGEWWRLLTNCFLHIGIFHLLLNMYALLYIGILLEPYLGRTIFASAYLLSGIVASVASLWAHPLLISAGASGAIFGMYGVFLAMLTTNLIEKAARKALLSSIVVFVGYNLLNGLKENSGIDNAAHLGGLIGGLVIGYALIPGLKRPVENRMKFSIIGLLAAVILVSSFIVYERIPNDIGIYERKIKEFVQMEEKALEVYHLPTDTPNDKILYGIKEKGIHYWNENIKLLESFKDLDLPPQIIERNQLLREYCDLRIKSYELLYKSISEDTEKYKADIEDYNKQIEAKINELKGS
jgi:rhomboid protease GluP